MPTQSLKRKSIRQGKNSMKRKTYLLVHPEISRTKYNFKGIIENECLELEHISAVLKAEGNDVFLYDGQVEERAIEKAFNEYKPDVVYVCGRTRQENFMLEYCRRAKNWNDKVITMIGGLHAQLCYERMYKKEVDYILTSYNIFHISKLADGEYKDLSEVEGICYREKNEQTNEYIWKHNQAEAFDINLLPFPDRTYFYEHPDNYRYLEMEHAAWVRTSYSCPYRCKFCHRNRMNNSTYSARDIEKVVDEIESIPDKNIYIVDDDFLFNEQRLEKFIALIKERNIDKKYICYGRADFISTHEELMKQLKEIGFYYILVGIEAIDDRLLEDYDKRTDVIHNLEAIRICQKYDLQIMAMFILDLDFREKDFKALYEFIKKYRLKHVALSIYTPELGLESYDKYKDRIITDNPSHFDYLHLVAAPTNMPVKKYYKCYYTLLIKLFLKAQREGVYDFIDYGDYVKSFVRNMFMKKRKNDDE